MLLGMTVMVMERKLEKIYLQHMVRYSLNMQDFHGFQDVPISLFFIQHTTPIYLFTFISRDGCWKWILDAHALIQHVNSDILAKTF